MIVTVSRRHLGWLAVIGLPISPQLALISGLMSDLFLGAPRSHVYVVATPPERSASWRR